MDVHLGGGKLKSRKLANRDAFSCETGFVDIHITRNKQAITLNFPFRLDQVTRHQVMIVNLLELSISLNFHPHNFFRQGLNF